MTWHVLQCTAIGLIAVVVVATILHLWARLWYRILGGQWRFRMDDAIPTHLAVIALTILAGVILMICYPVGCWLLGLRRQLK